MKKEKIGENPIINLDDTIKVVDLTAVVPIVSETENTLQKLENLNLTQTKVYPKSIGQRIVYYDQCPQCRSWNAYHGYGEYYYGPDEHGIICWNCGEKFLIVDLRDYFIDDEEGPNFIAGLRPA